MNMLPFLFPFILILPSGDVGFGDFLFTLSVFKNTKHLCCSVKPKSMFTEQEKNNSQMAKKHFKSGVLRTI